MLEEVMIKKGKFVMHAHCNDAMSMHTLAYLHTLVCRYASADMPNMRREMTDTVPTTFTLNPPSPPLRGQFNEEQAE